MNCCGQCRSISIEPIETGYLFSLWVVLPLCSDILSKVIREGSDHQRLQLTKHHWTQLVLSLYCGSGFYWKLNNVSVEDILLLRMRTYVLTKRVQSHKVMGWQVDRQNTKRQTGCQAETDSLFLTLFLESYFVLNWAGFFFLHRNNRRLQLGVHWWTVLLKGPRGVLQQNLQWPADRDQSLQSELTVGTVSDGASKEHPSVCLSHDFCG